MTIARWILATPFGIFFAWMALMNAWLLVQTLRKRKRESAYMLLGGITGVLAVLISPSIAMHRFWYVPLIVDLGCAPLIVSAAVYFAVHALHDRLIKEGPSTRELPPEVIAGIEKILPTMFTETAREMLAELIPHLHLDERPRERARVLLAAIRRSNGDIARLEGSVRMAKQDWRDVLVSAGLADEDWEKILRAEGFEVPRG